MEEKAPSFVAASGQEVVPEAFESGWRDPLLILFGGQSPARMAWEDARWLSSKPSWSDFFPKLPGSSLLVRSAHSRLRPEAAVAQPAGLTASRFIPSRHRVRDQRGGRAVVVSASRVVAS